MVLLADCAEAVEASVTLMGGHSKYRLEQPLVQGTSGSGQANKHDDALSPRNRGTLYCKHADLI